MPYIQKHRRDIAYKTQEGLFVKASWIETAGELNYVISMLCDDYLKRYGTIYDSLNEVVGVLECAKLEFYRRIVTPYEEDKISLNGDIYGN